jgi:uncharacterized protein (TIGR00255 family)
MTNSMTAFARVQGQVGSTAICWELKSVNHRYLETSFRLPESFRFIELNLRNDLRGQVSRGKLDCQLKIDFIADAQQSFVINEGLVKAILTAGEKLAKNQHLANDITVSQVLSWPGIAEISRPDSSALGKEIEQLFHNAVEQLVFSRQDEGKKLKEFIKSRLQLLAEQVELSRAQIEVINSQARAKLISRIEGLNLTVAEGRIEQEIALILAKLDISEEIDRLKAHIDEVSLVLERNEAVGRRLDFLMQELNREANTLSSKSDSTALTKHAVEMKVLIEQMREQIANIE